MDFALQSMASVVLWSFIKLEATSASFDIACFSLVFYLAPQEAQSVQIFVAVEHHAAPPAAVAATGPTHVHAFLAAHRHAPVTTVATVHVDRCRVEEVPFRVILRLKDTQTGSDRMSNEVLC